VSALQVKVSIASRDSTIVRLQDDKELELSKIKKLDTLIRKYEHT
jgi:uncharacterized membrane protein YjjP (DUF1212 family)